MKITVTHIIALSVGVLVGLFLCHSGCNGGGETTLTVHDTIRLMEKPVSVITENPKPAYTGGNTTLPPYFPPTMPPVDSTNMDSLIRLYIACKQLYDSLYVKADSSTRMRFYKKLIEDSLITIAVEDSVQGFLNWQKITYFVKPIPYSATIKLGTPIELFANIGWDITQKSPGVGVDLQYGKYTFGYFGNGKSLNSVKVGYQLWQRKQEPKLKRKG